MRTFKARSFLVVAHQESVAVAANRVLSLYRRSRSSRVEGEGVTWLEALPPIGILLEAEPNVAEALDVLARLRERYPYVPAVLLAEKLTPSEIERGYRLRASNLPLRTDPENLLPFVFRCLTEEAVCDERVGCLVESLVRGGSLTAREAELLVMVLADVPREEIAVRMCITENTVKAHTRQMLRKLEASDLDKLAARIFRVALQSGGRGSWVPSGSGERPAVRPEKSLPAAENDVDLAAGDDE
jgi:DNA-binding NarL/FixJ family response regulator